MPNSRCPNIRSAICTLREEINKLKALKTMFLKGDPLYEECLEYILLQIENSVFYIDYGVDEIANEIVVPDFIRARKYLYLGSDCSQGRIKVRERSGEYQEFHINIKGNPVYVDKYESAGSFIDNTARVKTTAGECFHIDRHGKPRYKNRYKTVSDYKHGIAKVETFNGEKFKIDLDGNRIID
jgi:hypothetical protein